MYNYRIGTIADIPIRINISLVVFLPLLAYLLARPEQITLYAGLVEGTTQREYPTPALLADATPLVIGIISAIGLFVSVLIHELGHSWAARRYGIPIASITLWIFGGVAALERFPREWNREFWIAVAGPVTSVLLGIVCLAGAFATPTGLPVVGFLLGWLGVINIILAGFNLLPAFPMDGGRILRALLARRQPYVDATRTAARVGRWMAIGLAVLAVLALNLILLLVALFVFLAATTESRMVILDDLLKGVTAGDLMSTEHGTVSQTLTVDELVDRMLVDRRTVYHVVDETGTTVGTVTLEHLTNVAHDDRPTTRIADVMGPRAPMVDAALPAFEVLRLLNDPRTPHVIVGENGNPTGVITLEDISTVLTLLRGVGRNQRPPAWVEGYR